MAATIPHLCPYCGHDNIVFTVVYAFKHPVSTDDAIFECQASCGACHRCAVITLKSEDGHSPLDHVGCFDMMMNNKPPLELVDFQPKPEIKNPPRHIPADVEKAMLQMYAVAPKKHKDIEMFEPTVIMARKALERAIKHISPDSNGMLGQRINMLEKDGIIPKVMGDWAKTISLIGNAGAHDAISSKEDARQAVLFIEMFLTYTFTMPEEIRIKRKG